MNFTDNYHITILLFVAQPKMYLPPNGYKNLPIRITICICLEFKSVTIGKNIFVPLLSVYSYFIFASSIMASSILICCQAFNY